MEQLVRTGPRGRLTHQAPFEVPRQTDVGQNNTSYPQGATVPGSGGGWRPLTGQAQHSELWGNREADGLGRGVQPPSAAPMSCRPESITTVKMRHSQGRLGGSVG